MLNLFISAEDDDTCIFRVGRTKIYHVAKASNAWNEIVLSNDTLDFIKKVPSYNYAYHNNISFESPALEAISSIFNLLFKHEKSNEILGFAIINEININNHEGELAFYINPNTGTPFIALDAFVGVMTFMYNHLGLNKVNFCTFDKKFVDYMQRIGIAFVKQNTIKQYDSFSKKTISYYIGQFDMNLLKESRLLGARYNIEKLLKHNFSETLIIDRLPNIEINDIKNKNIRDFALDLMKTDKSNNISGKTKSERMEHIKFISSQPEEFMLNGMMQNGIEIMVTSACNLNCISCSHAGFRSIYQDFSLSLEELETFLYYTQKSNHKFRWINICGGEPTIWEHLNEGIELIHKKLGSIHINLISNGLKLNAIRDEVLQYLSKIYITDYPGINIDHHVQLLQSRAKKINTLEIVRHIMNWCDSLPSQAYRHTLPANCNCNFPVFIKDKVFVCDHAYTGSQAIGSDLLNFPERYVELKINYLDHFKGLDIFNMDICQSCISNRKVNSIIGKVEWKQKIPNTSQRKSYLYTEN
ncbi:radical SAM protein [Candidatus Venteria ishoeyi]|uniref:Molybdenum cofactor biosynthesis protein A n=1 Tax=Candidatus Venteria ishoeyi TaxID=1899563 RepID=A0A1H6F6H0_9GAMM|nr:radical SAM protein [Candidatus Venteria ishoeyi]SEH04575.1 molybdenum cofactor biosynthesis protein A [Candidatus Venteria ishoeyi]